MKQATGNRQRATGNGRIRCLLPVACCLLSVSLLYASPAGATECAPPSRLSTCVNADILWPHAGAGPFFSLGPGFTTPATWVSFGMVMSYLSRPIGIRVPSPDPEGTSIYAIDNA